jgi:hypothetical protein
LSFVFISRSFRRPRWAKPAFLLCLILAGCGGAASSKWQPVQGKGFAFSAPVGWSVSGAAATSGPVDRVEVVVFRLLRPYERSRRRAVARELDGVAGRLVQQLHGTLRRSASIAVGGLDARSYTIDYGDNTAEITFVLPEGREYPRLGRRPPAGDDGACRELVASFRVQGA